MFSFVKKDFDQRDFSISDVYVWILVHWIEREEFVTEQGNQHQAKSGSPKTPSSLVETLGQGHVIIL